ncbi:MAG: lysylphosphatidylglycerol synthase transmembrane domain-containing protein [Acidiferrobacterales bacterium]
MTDTAGGGHRQRWWSAGAGSIAVAVLAWILWRIDFARLSAVVAEAHLAYLFLVPLAIALEQLVRAWKWRQLLYEIQPIGTFRLFGAIMAGYLGGLLIPFGVSPLVRSWLIARLQRLRMSAVLATVAVDRLVDGVVFSGFVAVALILAVFPDPRGDIRLGLMVGGAGSLALFTLLLIALARYKLQVGRADGWIMRLADRLPARVADRAVELMRSFADGIVWPRAPWRGVGIVLAGILIKLIAITHFLWAGLAFGVVLHPADYIFLVVFLGFLVILTHFARIPAGFLIGAIFALGLVGVGEEQALAMALVVQFSSMLTVAGLGAVALWRNGIALGDLQIARGGAAMGCLRSKGCKGQTAGGS